MLKIDTFQNEEKKMKEKEDPTEDKCPPLWWIWRKKFKTCKNLLYSKQTKDVEW